MDIRCLCQLYLKVPIVEGLVLLGFVANLIVKFDPWVQVVVAGTESGSSGSRLDRFGRGHIRARIGLWSGSGVVEYIVYTRSWTKPDLYKFYYYL